MAFHYSGHRCLRSRISTSPDSKLEIRCCPSYCIHRDIGVFSKVEKYPEEAKYSHAYPAGKIVGLFNKIFSGICLVYLLVNVWYSDRFSTWEYCVNTDSFPPIYTVRKCWWLSGPLCTQMPPEGIVLVKPYIIKVLWPYRYKLIGGPQWADYNQ